MKETTKAAISMWCFAGLRMVGGFAWGAGFTDGGAVTKALMGAMGALYVVGSVARHSLLSKQIDAQEAALDALEKRLRERAPTAPRDVN